MKIMFKNFVGIDVSKSKFDLALIKDSDKDHVMQGVFDNTQKGIKSMRKFLEKEHLIELSETIFCMEFTGVYCRPLTRFMVENDCHVWIEMPVNIIRSFGLQRGKNDHIDAHRIVLYAYKNRDDIKLWKPQRDVILRLRDILALRERLITAKKSLEMPIEELKIMGDKIGADKVRKSCQKSLTSIKKEIDQIDKDIDETVKKDPLLKDLFQLATSVPGVGKVTALFMICFTNEFSMYTNPKQLACYCGVAPFEHSSGSSIRGRTRVSHMANKVLKRMLHMGAMSVISRDPELREYYQRKVAQGKNKMLVINAVRNKIIHRLCAVIKRGYGYQSEIIFKEQLVLS
jgi:transposase